MKARRPRCAGGKKEQTVGVILLGFGRVTEKSIVVEIRMKNLDGLLVHLPEAWI